MSDTNEKKHVISGFLPVTALFLLFVMSFTRLQTVVVYLLSIGLASHGLEYALQITLTVLELAGYVFSLISIIQVMRDKADSLCSLRCTLWFNLFICLYGNSSKMVFFTASEYVILAWSIIKALFCIIFLIYTYFSKRIAREFPKKNRRYGVFGWTWIGGWCMTLAVFVSFGSILMKKQKKSLPVGIEDISISPGQYTDGSIILASGFAWDRIEPQSGIDYEDIIFGKYELVLKDSTIDARIRTSIQAAEPTRRTFNQQIFRFCPYDEDYIGPEVASLDTIINDRVLYSNVYQIQKDSVVSYWSFATLYDKESYKRANLSMSSSSKEKLQGFLLNVASRISFSPVVNK